VSTRTKKAKRFGNALLTGSELVPYDTVLVIEYSHVYSHCVRILHSIPQYTIGNSFYSTEDTLTVR